MRSSASGQGSILIVDDMEENLIALEAVLSPLNQQITRARSGEEALKAMLRQDFAVVLLDVLMPGMDGFETAANIKRLDQTKDVPIILLTGQDTGSDFAYRGYAIGAADFLTKPIDPWVLRMKVDIFLEMHRKNRQLSEQAAQLRRLWTNSAPSEDPLGEVAGLLTTVEVLLRDHKDTDTASLADRVGEVQRAVRGLRGEGP